MRAERKSGELLAEAKKSGARKGEGQPKKEPSARVMVLSDLGISLNQSSQWQRPTE
jgi:hypothetical protein